MPPSYRSPSRCANVPGNPARRTSIVAAAPQVERAGPTTTRIPHTGSTASAPAPSGAGRLRAASRAVRIDSRPRSTPRSPPVSAPRCRARPGCGSAPVRRLGQTQAASTAPPRCPAGHQPDIPDPGVQRGTDDLGLGSAVTGEHHRRGAGEARPTSSADGRSPAVRQPRQRLRDRRGADDPHQRRVAVAAPGRSPSRRRTGTDSPRRTRPESRGTAPPRPAGPAAARSRWSAARPGRPCAPNSARTDRRRTPRSSRRPG